MCIKYTGWVKNLAGMILREDGYCLNSTECHGIWGRNMGGKGRVRKDYVRLCEVDF